MEKQIEEMAQTLVDTFNERRGRVNMKDLAESLHHAGYRKASDAAVEIIDDLEEKLDYLDTYGYTEEGCDACVTFEDVRRLFEQLKKKYLGEAINAPTKESEGNR